MEGNRMTKKRFGYLFGVFFDNKIGISDYKVLSILNTFNDQLIQQAECMEKIAVYFGFDSVEDMIRKIGSDMDD